MHSNSSDAHTFTCIWPSWATHQYRKKFCIQYAFAVKNHHDLTYTLLTGKRNWLLRLRRQKKRSESYFRTVSHGLQPTHSLPSLIFLVYWLEENTPPTFLRFGELEAQTTSFTALHKQCFRYTGTLQPRTEGACMSKQPLTQTVETLKGKICINGVATDCGFFEVYVLWCYSVRLSETM